MRSLLHRLPAFAVISAITLAGCGPFHRGAQPDTEILFHNQSIDQADVYAMGPGGDPIRVGTVDGQRTAKLRVPTRMGSPPGPMAYTSAWSID